MSEKARLQKFVRAMLANVPPATKFRLYHARAEGGPESLFLAKAEGDNLDATSEAIASKAIEVSGQVTASFGGMPQRFLLTAISGEKEKIGTHPWLDKSSRALPIVPSGFGESTEPPTSAGLLSSMMRHVEISNRTLVEATAGILEHQTRVIEEQRELLEANAKDRMKLTMLLEDLRSRKQEREMQREEYERSEARKDMIMSTIATQVLPEVAGYVKGYIGKKVVAAMGSSDGAAASGDKTKERLQALAHSLSEEQQTKLLELLRPEQAVLLAEAIGGEDAPAEDKGVH